MRAARGSQSTRPGTSGVTMLAIVVTGILLVSAVLAASATLYRLYWGPEAFVERYLGMLSTGRAADALTVAGVALESDDFADQGIENASDALLRNAAIAGPLTDIRLVSSRMVDGVAEVQVAYETLGTPARSTFRVAQSGWSGIIPQWKFASSPLALLDVTVHGSMRFTVNGFELDKRQVSPAGLNTDPATPLQFLVFTPSRYAISVDTATAVAEAVDILADEPHSVLDADVRTKPSPEFQNVVTDEVTTYLEACTEQRVLQPSGCPFGFPFSEVVVDQPNWSMSDMPDVVVVPDGQNWAIAPASGTAKVAFEAKRFFDGSRYDVDEAVDFTISGSIQILADGTAAISFSSPDIPSRPAAPPG